MKQNDWQKAYNPPPEKLYNTVNHTLAGLPAQKPRRPMLLRVPVIALAALLALCGVAYALFQSQTAELFGWFYGDGKKAELLSGDIAPVGQSCQLGDVIYTFDDAIYQDGTVYGTGTMRAADGANLVLIAEDYGIHEPAGYALRYDGGEAIPDGAPSYAGLAEQKGAKIVLARCVANGVVNPDGSLNADCIGYSQLPQADGSIKFMFEFAGGSPDDPAMTLERSDSYDVSLHIANWEVNQYGEWLREEPNDTWLTYDWVVTVAPVIEEE